MKCPKCGSTEHRLRQGIPGLDFTICAQCQLVLSILGKHVVDGAGASRREGAGAGNEVLTSHRGRQNADQER
jgi:hypothetical protein